MTEKMGYTYQPVNHDQLTHPKYRADIDGLRAIAVLSVVGFHAFPNWFMGGFIGVDIFFVISGFLISTILISNLEHNTFSFVEFYNRRINRIFPALLVVICFCFAFGWFALLPDEYKQLGKHIVGGTGFVSNFFLWNESSYFDNAAETKPLLHLWSLGIEEQFYIVWPLFLWLALKKKFNFILITLVVAIISFVLNIGKSGNDLVAAFYSPQTRFWELMAGSVLAYGELHKEFLLPTLKRWLTLRSRHMTNEQTPVAKSQRSSDFQSAIGALLIAIGVLVTSKDLQFPGWWALLPVFGAVLVILGGAQAWLNRVLLSNRLLVWFGLISFPLYLWHWPLLSFARILTSEVPSPEVRVAVVLLSIILAWLTYQYVERPIRFGLKNTHKILSLILIAITFGLAGYYIYVENGIGSRIKVTNGALNELKIRHGSFYEAASDCSDKYTPLIINTWCAKKSNNPVIAVIGDSHAGQLFLGIVQSNNTLSNALFMGAGSCYPTLGLDSREGCGKQLKLALDIIEKTKSIKYVVIASFYGWADKDEASGRLFLAGYRKSIYHLLSIGKKVVFAIDNPALRFDPESCLMQRRPIEKLLRKVRSKTSLCPSEKTENLKDQSKYRLYVEELEKLYPDVLFYDPHKKLCNNGVCKLFDNGKLLYSDWSHLSQYGSSFLSEDIFAQIKSKWQSTPFAIKY